ncbi:MAG: hypothetical protein JNK04_03750 [Myxococcales bacterium]|nr:hypothetical protein [Myxococcales bacterium]
MLEILLLIALTRALSRIAKSKQQSPMWGGLVVLLWISGEVAGFVVAGLMGLGGVEAYGIALGGAAIGAGVSFLAVTLLPVKAYVDPWAAVDAADNAPPPNYDPSNPYTPPKQG